jgi:hypothetical protein
MFGLVFALAVASGAFAQFAINGGISTDFSTVTPTIGVSIGFSKLDILAGVDLNWAQNSFYTPTSGTNNYDDTSSSVGIYFGLAPKAALTEKWALSFPLLVRIQSEETSERRYNSDTVTAGSTSDAGSAFSGFGLRAGGRAAYAFSDHWSLYTGFLINVVSFNETKTNKWKTSNREDGTELAYTETAFDIFKSGVVELSVGYRF